MKFRTNRIIEKNKQGKKAIGLGLVYPSADAIERQLAHVEGNSVRAAYNYADYLDERRRMMQWWAEYLDNLKVPSDKPT